MATYKDGDITYTVSLEMKELLENSKKVQQELKELKDSGTKASKGLDDVEKSAKNAGTSMSKLTTIAKAVSAALLSSQIVAYAEAWNELEDRIGNTGATALQTKDTLDALLVTSNRNGRTIEESAELYIRLSNSMKEMGVSTQGTLAYIDTLSNLFTINKTSALKSEAAINALTKAQMKGKLSGEDAMTVFNAMPSILQTLGNSFNKTEPEVRKMASDGKLSMQDFTQAMIGAQSETASLADNMRNNVGDGINRVTNNLKQYLGELNNSTGATKLLVDSLVLLSENVDILVTGVGVLGAIYAGNYITSLAAATKQSTAKVISTIKESAATKQLATEELKALEIEGRKLTARRQELIALKAVTTSKTQLAVIDKQLNAINAQRSVLIEKETAAQTRLASVVKLSSIAMTGLKSAMSLLGGPMGIIMIAAGALMTWSNNAEEAKQKALSFAQSVDDVSDSLKGLTANQLNTKMDDANDNLALVEEQSKKTRIELERLKLLAESKFNRLDTEYGTTQGFEKLKREIRDLETELDTFSQSKDKINEQLKRYQEVLDVVTGKTKDVTQSTNDFNSALDDATKSKVSDKIRDISTELEIAEMKLSGASKEAYIYENALSTLGDSGEKYKETLKGILDGTIQWAELSEDLRATLQTLINMLGTSYDKSEKLKASQKSSKASTKSYADEIKTLRDKLEVAKLESQGLTVEAELLSISQKMGSKATAEQTAELKDLISAAQAYKALGSLKSPIDVENDSFNQSKQSLDKLLQLGEIKQADYNSKIEQLEQKHQIEMAKIKSEATVSNTDNAVAMVDPVQALANENAKKLELIKQFEEQKLITEQNAIALREAANYQYEQNRINAQWDIWKNQSAANDFLASSLEGLASSATSTISGLMSGTMSATDAMKNFANVILNEAIGSLVQMGMQYVKNAIMSQSASAATTAVQTAEAVALAAAYQPAAMYASIATQGQAPMLGAAAYAASVGTMKALSIAGGREHGGSVAGNSTYRVGEGGKPEILMQGGKQYLIPGENGKVLSNKEINSNGSGGTTNISVTQNITFEGEQDTNESAQQTGRAFEQAVVSVIQKQQMSGGVLNNR